MKKLIQIFIALQCVVFFTANVFAYNFTVDGIYYNVNSDNTTVSVTYKTTNYNSYSGDIVIPSEVTYNETTYSVTKIGNEAFRYCRNLTSIVIPNSITSIGNGAFYDCRIMTSILIPNSVTYLGDRVFGHCSVLDSVVIPNSVTYIGVDLFYSCEGLTSIVLPNSISSLRTEMFRQCTGLSSITIPNNITEIEGHVFEGCSNLSSVTLSDNLIAMGEWAFWGCSRLSSITIPSNVASIGNYAFSSCSSLRTVVCKGVEPASITNVTFYGLNYNNMTLIVPCEKQSVYHQAIGWSAFTNIEEDCVGLNDIEQENSIIFYPNPVKDNVSLNAEGNVVIYNNLGQIVKHVNNVNAKTTISVADLKKGVYYLKVGNKQQKLVKE